MPDRKDLTPARLRERELREKCAQRVSGLGEIVKQLRDTDNPDDLAAAAFLLGSLDDISAYVDVLRELAGV